MLWSSDLFTSQILVNLKNKQKSFYNCFVFHKGIQAIKHMHMFFFYAKAFHCGGGGEGCCGKLCPITSRVSKNPSLDIGMQAWYNSKCTNPLFHMSQSSHHVHSPFVLKKDILVPWGMTTLMSRDELLIEWGGQVRQFTCRVPYQAVSAVIHVFDIYRKKKSYIPV